MAKLKTYRVCVQETTTKYIEVEATSKKEAMSEAENSDESDFYGHEWEAQEAIWAEEVTDDNG
jgi:hypothetical protein